VSETGHLRTGDWALPVSEKTVFSLRLGCIRYEPAGSQRCDGLIGSLCVLSITHKDAKRRPNRAFPLSTGQYGSEERWRALSLHAGEHEERIADLLLRYRIPARHLELPGIGLLELDTLLELVDSCDVLRIVRIPRLVA
jgi:hypothetical protein